jgi:small neutral amino acid transporter SnatA (MarC family)
VADFNAASAAVEGIAVLAATNPPRVWSALPLGPDRRRAATAAGGVTLVVAVVLAALASGLLDLLDVSTSTFRVGAGLVIAVVGAHDLAAGAPKPEPSLKGWKAGFVPLAFPLLVNPAFGAGALMAGADHGMATPVVATLVGVALLLVLSTTAEHARVLRGVGRMVGAALVILGIALAVDGVFSL